MEHAVEAVAGLGALLDQPLAMGNQAPQLTDVGWRNPNSRYKVGGQEPSKRDGVAGIGLDLCRDNQLDGQGMGDWTAPTSGLRWSWNCQALPVASSTTAAALVRCSCAQRAKAANPNQRGVSTTVC